MLWKGKSWWGGIKFKLAPFLSLEYHKDNVAKHKMSLVTNVIITATFIQVFYVRQNVYDPWWQSFKKYFNYSKK